MHSAKTAYETLDFLWHNYQALANEVDTDAMDSEALARVAKQPRGPFRIATWLGRQGYFFSAWGLWEYYSGQLCAKLTRKVKKRRRESHAGWVKRSLEANDIDFPQSGWFSSAGNLRNLLAHHGGRVTSGPRAESLFRRAHVAFPDIEPYRDGYVFVTPCHVATLQLKIRDFICEMAKHDGP